MAYANLTGFSVDAPSAIVKTANGDYSTVTADSATITFGGDTIQITGGDGFYNIAEIDKSKKIDIKITDAQYSMQSQALGTGAAITSGADTYDVYGKYYTADSTGLIIVPNAVVPSSVRINGYTEVTGTIASGQFKVTVGASTTSILFTPTEAGITFSPSYSVAVANATTLTGLTNSFPKSGEVRVTYSVYSDATAADSTIIGTMQLTIYKAKITQAFVVGGGVKAAQKFDLTLSALDPRRNDLKMWKSTFIPLAVDTTAPTVLSVVPANSSTGIVGSAPIIWTFSEPINPATVNANNFVITKSTDGTTPAGSYVLSANNTVITFTPTTALTTATKYFLTVNTNIADVNGNHLLSNNNTSFTVA